MKIPVLLLQLGTPDDPSVPAVRRYLREFLSDPRVVETNRLVWWFILNGIVLPFRPARSAEKYRRIWDPEKGMPLLHYSRQQAADLQAALGLRFRVELAMRYGQPNIRDVIRRLAADRVGRLIVVPMYPHSSATTTASALDGLFAARGRERVVPAVTVVPPYYDDPGFVEAQAALITSVLAALPQPPDHYLLSYHGIPQRYAKAGDPYAQHVERGTQALVRLLGWPKGRWSRTYQSLFGREEWLKPYTEEKVKELAHAGKKRLVVATPGFTADCLETIDEIGFEVRQVFEAAGGEQLHRCPCVNAHPKFVEALARLVHKTSGTAPA
ncbi:MAG TPA: ferrochelatase [Gemmatales bacterium]|nr:ferrochelatase [Gemmatales bacterium]